MPKQDLKQKLRGADRRRSRRPAPIIEATPRSECASIDVPELIAFAILEYVDSCQAEMRDAIVVSAMRSCLTGGVATGEHSIPLSERLERITQRTDVSRRSFREALQQMMKLASEYRDPKNSSAFIHHLSLLAS
jgi:hypothetical protein